MLLGFFFLGIEQLAVQLEEPFSVLPLTQIASSVKLSAEEHYRWTRWALDQEDKDPNEREEGFGFQ